MGARFRVLACPVDVSTGDRRRFAPGSITHQDLPMPLGWVREDGAWGHQGAVTVGLLDSVEETKGEIWLTGEIFDASDEGITPSILEDAASAMFLARKGTVGPSVDLDDFDAMPVRVGSDEPLTADDFDDENLEIEMLVTKGRMRSATLVRIPAFAETNHSMEFDDTGAEDDEAEGEPDDPADVDPELASARAAAIVRVLTATTGAPTYPVALFTPPVEVTGPMPIRYDFERGQAYGHIATWNVCHVGMPDSCVLAPRAGEGGYRDFHVHRVQTDEGVVYAGRITVGGDHAPRDGDLSAHDVRTVYNTKRHVGWVFATEDQYGIFICGPLTTTDPADVPQVTTPIGGGRHIREHAVSGDWRETSGGLALLEVLALEPGPPQSSQPGFPIPRVRFGFAGGRQVALTASLMPPSVVEADARAVFAGSVAHLVREELARAQASGEAKAELNAILEADAAAERKLLIDAMEG